MSTLEIRHFEREHLEKYVTSKRIFQEWPISKLLILRNGQFSKSYFSEEANFQIDRFQTESFTKVANFRSY